MTFLDPSTSAVHIIIHTMQFLPPAPKILYFSSFSPCLSLSPHHSQMSLSLDFVLNLRVCQSVLSLVRGSASCPVLELCSRTLLQMQETFWPFADSHSSFRRAKPQ